MKIQNLNDYYFHDSGLLKIEHINNSITLTILYCLFMQEEYQEGEPENSLVTLTFNNVINYDIPDRELHNDSIIEVKIDDNKCTFALQNSYTDEFYMFSIEAESVEFSTIKIIDDLKEFYNENNL